MIADFEVYDNYYCVKIGRYIPFEYCPFDVCKGLEACPYAPDLIDLTGIGDFNE